MGVRPGRLPCFGENLQFWVTGPNVCSVTSVTLERVDKWGGVLYSGTHRGRAPLERERTEKVRTYLEVVGFDCSGFAPETWNGWDVPLFSQAQLCQVRAWYEKETAHYPNEDWEPFDAQVEAAGDLFTLPGWAFTR